ncbi:MAG: RluA family pseudouridine synthase [Actinomycetota bacterium]
MTKDDQHGGIPASFRALPIPEGLDGERIDLALVRLLGLSRTKVTTLINSHDVKINGEPIHKSHRATAGSWLEVSIPTERAIPQSEQPVPLSNLKILYEDVDLVVLDKPVGAAVHSAPGWTGPTVLAGLAAAGVVIAPVGPPERFGVVHRLDVGTSGVMVIAKSERAYSSLKQAFRDREVKKTYHAVIQGHPDPLKGTIDAPIGRHPNRDGLWAVVRDGKPSVTHYEVMEAFPSASLMRVRLETGRTHQIRVHFSALRHPCLGDVSYGADPTLAHRLGLTRQWLHAVELMFVHPGTGLPVRFRSAYPDDLLHALTTLQSS